MIYDRCQPEKMPRANTLFIGAVPPADSDATISSSSDAAPRARPQKKETVEPHWSLGEQVTYPQIIDSDRTHPLMQWLDLGDVDIAAARPVTPPSGGTRLIDSSKGTLLAIAPREGFEDAVLGFDLYSTDQNGEQTPNTNWAIRRSFPSFVYAVLSYLGGASGVQAGESVKPGQTITLHSEAPSSS